MTWLQILAQAGVMATFVGVGMAMAAFYNGKYIKEGVSKISEMLNEIEKTADQRHRDTVELLKRGFGDLSRDVGEIKEAVNK